LDFIGKLIDEFKVTRNKHYQTKMKYTQFFVQALAFLALTKICYSAEASKPEYLSIEGFQNCTGR